MWEPILPTDWRSPTNATLARISDARAVQFWDPHHLVSQELKHDLGAYGVPVDGHTSGGSLWDLAIIYPHGTTWTTVLPAPSFFGGAVVTVASPLETKLHTLTASP